MTYSSTAVRFFTAPKPLGNAMDAAQSPQHLETPSKTSTGPMTEISASNRQAEGPKPDAVDAAPAREQKKGLTFSNQESLPKLPVPDLENTCRRYLESLSALQTPREQTESKAAVEEFLRTDGPALQEKLKNYASLKTSYIEQFCKLPVHCYLLLRTFANPVQGTILI